MMLTAPTLLILTVLGIVQLAAGVLLGRMLPESRPREQDVRREKAADAARKDEAALLMEHRLARLVQLTGDLHARVQAIEERLGGPAATELPEDTATSTDPDRLVASLQSRLAELARD